MKFTGGVIIRACRFLCGIIKSERQSISINANSCAIFSAR
jgi:hypothetical protein